MYVCMYVCLCGWRTEIVILAHNRFLSLNFFLFFHNYILVPSLGQRGVSDLSNNVVITEQHPLSGTMRDTCAGAKYTGAICSAAVS